MRKIDLAFSSCPNDTLTFHALLHGCIDTGPFSFTPYIEDVETLNREALTGRFQVTKLSFFAYLHVRERYDLLDAGAALGFGCGPLLVARSKDISLSQARIAAPGSYTTAHLLLRLWRPDLPAAQVVRFDEILTGIESGRFDAGVIIHEGRFVYPEYGCAEVIDLGAWWEAETGFPVPLGCIALRKDPDGREIKADMERLVHDSVAFGLAHPEASREFVRSYAQELAEGVVDAHIGLYVNDFSLSLGEEGGRAVAALEEMARCRGVL
jgi:1,4-dihydroxy-6-naphthoate synthase